jgi:glycine cleavage system H protein
MEIPAELRYTTEDEWLRLEDDGTAVVGITDYAQDQLGDIVFLELPEPGRTIAAGEPFGVVESVKAVSDLYMPVAGEVVASNEALEQSPQLVNESPYGDGWIIRIRPTEPAEVDALLTAEAYRAQLPAEGE